MAQQLEKLGAHFLAIKDMAGLCKPYAAFELVKTLRQEIAIPIHFHTHDTSGLNAASILKAADAGVDVADAAIASMSGGTSQPNLNAIVEALRHTPRDTQLDIETLNRMLRLLGNRPHFLRAFRLRTEVRLRAPLSTRNSRRPVHQSARASHRHGPRPPLARSRKKCTPRSISFSATS